MTMKYKVVSQQVCRKRSTKESVHTFEVYLDKLNQTMFVNIGEGKCTLTTANVRIIDFTDKEYKKIVVNSERLDDANPTGEYVDLFKECLQRFARQEYDDNKTSMSVPFAWLAEELQQQISAEETLFVDTHESNTYLTNGYEASFVAETGRKCVYCKSETFTGEYTQRFSTEPRGANSLLELMSILATMESLPND